MINVNVYSFKEAELTDDLVLRKGDVVYRGKKIDMVIDGLSDTRFGNVFGASYLSPAGQITKIVRNAGTSNEVVFTR
jgi:hypothetical protein